MQVIEILLRSEKILNSYFSLFLFLNECISHECIRERENLGKRGGNGLRFIRRVWL